MGVRVHGRAIRHRIFLSYRRDDTSGYAGRLFDALAAQFGRDSVFIDIDTIKPGRDFVEAMNEALGSCDILLVLIGPAWLTVRDERGFPRLNDPADFVRMEIESGLAHDLNIVPLLVGGTSMPGKETLPASLESLTRRQAVTLSDHHWKSDVGELISALREQPRHNEVKATPAVPTTATTQVAGAVAPPGNRRGPTRAIVAGLTAAVVIVAAAVLFITRTDKQQPAAVGHGPGPGTLGPTGSTATSEAPSGVGSATGPTNPLRPDRCTNAHLGYSVVVPSGWQANPDSAALWACTAFSPSPLNAAGVAADPKTAAVLMGSLADRPKNLAESVSVTGKNAVVGGQQALTVEFDRYDKRRAYAYLISLGHRTLVAALVQRQNESLTRFSSEKQVLDQMMASLQLQPETCHNSYDTRCGQFYYTVDPQNAPIEGSVSISPQNPSVGDLVTFTVTVKDPDADLFNESSHCFGDDSSKCSGTGLGVTAGDFIDTLVPAGGAVPSGGFSLPPPKPGKATFVLTHTYTLAGSYTFSFVATSSNSAALHGADPYASTSVPITKVVVVQ